MFLLSLFWPSTCSISLSLSLSCSFLFFFLLVLLFLLSFASFFFSLSLCFSLLCFCFMKTNNIKRFNCKVFFINPVSFLVSCLVFSFKSLFLIFVFLVFSYVFCSTSMFWFQKHKLKNTNVWSKGELQQNRVFLITCVLQNVKSYRFFAPFLAIFG